MNGDDDDQSDLTCESLDHAELVATVELQLSEVDMLQVREDRKSY